MQPNESKSKLWNGALEYLKKSRYSWWNEDYLEFLIEKVWKITEAVSVIDFGCGIGFLGEILLPLLPEGSSYTGVDIGDKLLEEAKRIFEDKKYETHFIYADVCDFETEKKYDIAISQAVFQHIENPIPVLERMKDSVVEGGLVIAMDVSRDMNSSALYIDGFDYSKLNLLGIEQKLRRNILEETNKDFEIGLKLPVHMKKIGLKNVDIRLNDYVQCFDSIDSDYIEQYEAFTTGQYEKLFTEDMKDSFIKNIVSKGLTQEEAEKLFYGQQEITSFIHKNRNNISVVKSMCMLISYGYSFV
ncbi:methyltransferase domain-containing protein [Tissierella sp.]|uniref:class I SAM-dependent methyltransferase n=1 Tax=Tissierella sp. TaxID=41274 RepID=UPI0028646637|nr:methyltransferase domain-containing protein [Tissierella sp.]MDR7857848.1 methyltransferase domain-containing protein [Tissierella sp.]